MFILTALGMIVILCPDLHNLSLFFNEPRPKIVFKGNTTDFDTLNNQE